MAEEQPEFDCLAKAEAEGQPKPFVLIASDPLAPWLIELWTASSEGDVYGAISAFAGMLDTSVDRFAENPRSSAKLDSARAISTDMRNWRIGKGLK
jgi:hypothetical protein